jgi:4-hydroxybenzoate polyprenyltransferase
VTEAVTLCWLFVASVLSLGTDRRRGVPRPALFDSEGRTLLARVLGGLLVLAASVLYNAQEPGPAVFIAVPVALMATSTVVTLLAPVQPRLVWALAASALPLSLVLAALGALHV